LTKDQTKDIILTKTHFCQNKTDAILTQAKEDNKKQALLFSNIYNNTFVNQLSYQLKLTLNFDTVKLELK
jgi:hypothetical protein